MTQDEIVKTSVLVGGGTLVMNSATCGDYGGQWVNNACWFLGSTGESCTTVCNNQTYGPNPALTCKDSTNGGSDWNDDSSCSACNKLTGIIGCTKYQATSKNPSGAPFTGTLASPACRYRDTGSSISCGQIPDFAISATMIYTNSKRICQCTL